MNFINPSLTSFFNDPWYFEIPLAFKPTYLNMEIDYANIHMSDLLNDNFWNYNRLQTIFGSYLNDNIICQSQINYDQGNRWVWFPKSKETNLYAMIYSHFNYIKVVQKTMGRLG